MRATYAYEVLLGQLDHAALTREDLEEAIHDYSIYVRGMLEAQHPAAEVTAERIVTHVGKDIGWLLGEISTHARQRVQELLPWVEHPITGRDYDVAIDELMLAGARWVQGLPRGGAARAESTT